MPNSQREPRPRCSWALVAANAHVIATQRYIGHAVREKKSGLPPTHCHEGRARTTCILAKVVTIAPMRRNPETGRRGCGVITRRSRLFRGVLLRAAPAIESNGRRFRTNLVP